MNLDNICRLCMQDQTVLLPLFGGNGDLPAKIEFLTCVQVFIKEEDPSNESIFLTHIATEPSTEDVNVDTEDPLLLIKQEPTSTAATTIKNNDYINNDSILPDKVQRTERTPEALPVTTTSSSLIDRPRYECDSCPRKFFSFKGFKYHRGKHIQKHGYECMICNKKFHSWQRFRIHRQKHIHGLGLECPKCFKRFDSDNALRIHGARHHLDKPQLQCDICKKTYISEKSLIFHMKTHSLEERRHKCLVCNEEFSTGFGLRLHSRIHSIDDSPTGKPFSPPERRHQCISCKKRFFEYKGLITHQRYCKFRPLLKLPKPPLSSNQVENVPSRGVHECPFCQKVFDEFRSLSFHVRVHKRIDHRCSICNKRFKTKAGVGRHEKTHDSLPTSKVNTATSEFSYLQDTVLNSSDLTNLDEYEPNQIESVAKFKFECSICKEIFESAKTLDSHVMQIHRKEYSDGFTSHHDSIEAHHDKPVSRIESSLDENEIHSVHESTSTKSVEYTSQNSSQLSAINRQDTNDTDENISSKGPVLCNLCDRIFKNDKALSTHSIRSHNVHYKEPGVASYLSSSSGGEILNENVISKDQDPNKKSGNELAVGTECNICRQTFKSTKGLRNHITKTHQWDYKEINSTSHSEVQDNSTEYQNENVVANSNMSLSTSQFFSGDESSTEQQHFNTANQEINDSINAEVGENSCNICNKDFQNPRGLRAHNSKAHRWMYQYPKKASLFEMLNKANDTHQRPVAVDDEIHLPKDNDVNDSNDRADTTEEPISCTICKRFFKNRRALTTHIVKNHRLEYKFFGVSSNSELADVNFEVNSENNIQGDNDTLPTNENEMVESKENISNLMEHTDAVGQQSNDILQNASVSNTDCHICNRQFKSPKALRGHNSKVHKWMFKTAAGADDSAVVQCSLCPQRFRNERGLRTHMSKQHKEPKEQEEEATETTSSENVISENVEERGYGLRRHSWHNYNDESSHSFSSVNDETDNDNSRSFETSDFQTKHYCEECNKNFVNRKDLLVHKALVHDCLDSMEEIEAMGLVETANSDSEHHCQDCDKTFRSRKSLSSHNFEIHGKRSADNEFNKDRTSAPRRSRSSRSGYHCFECNKSFKKEKGLLVHNGMVHNIYPNAEYAGEDAYMSSTDDDDNENEVHDCYLCDKKFPIEAELTRHLSKVHKQALNETARNHICYVCNENFSTRSELRKHHNRVHNHPQNDATASHEKSSDYICQVCQFTTSKLRNFRFHCSRMDHLTPENLVQQPADSQEYLYECSLCYKTFFSQFSYTRHLKRCKENTGVSKKAVNIPAIEKPGIDSGVEIIELFSCDKCSYNSRTLEGLEVHCMKQHSDINEEDSEIVVPQTPTGSRFTCCNKSFSTQKGLNIHLSAIHRNDNLGKSRSEKFALASEESETLFDCSVCESSFTNEQSLIAHYSKKHKDKNTNSRVSDDGSNRSKTTALSITSVNNVDINVYVCCNKTFISKHKFNVHRTKVHKEGDDIPENRSDSQASGRRSVTNESNADIDYDCSFCNKSFTTERGLNIHVTMVHGESSKKDHNITLTKDEKIVSDLSHNETTVDEPGVGILHATKQNYQEEIISLDTADNKEMHSEEFIVVDDDDNNDNLHCNSNSSSNLNIENDDTSSFSCSTCKQSFHTEVELNEHCTIIHNNESADKWIGRIGSVEAEEMDSSVHDEDCIKEQMNSNEEHAEGSSTNKRDSEFGNSGNIPKEKVDSRQSEKCVFSEQGDTFEKQKINQETDSSESLPKVTNVHSLKGENSVFCQLAPEFKQEIYHDTITSESVPTDKNSAQGAKRKFDEDETEEEGKTVEKRTKIDVIPDSENNT
ncbi:hypothetical protein C0J52_05841 [Blattella germanica]|nr:hypothetical protein C0J52_05841 [Blattella germanica]